MTGRGVSFTSLPGQREACHSYYKCNGQENICSERGIIGVRVAYVSPHNIVITLYCLPPMGQMQSCVQVAPGWEITLNTST